MKAYRAEDGSVVFNYVPSVISEFSIPCGQCIGCRLSHAESWAIRQIHEADSHAENCFITLTYSDDHLPENSSLDYSHPTNFLKRLRSVLSKTPYHKKIRYYLVGEYGEKLSRPHYHILLFGFDFSYKIKYRGKTNEKQHWRSKGDRRYYTSTFLDDLWGMGHAEIGDLDLATCMYVSKYVTKKVSGQNKKDHYQSKQPEKAQMSKRPAIGHTFLKKFLSDVYPHDHIVHDARYYRVPRSYDKYLEKTNPELFTQIKISREENIDRKTQMDLTRSHEHKLCSVKQLKREFDESAPINHLEQMRLTYYKKLTAEMHQETKNAIRR